MIAKTACTALLLLLLALPTPGMAQQRFQTGLLLDAYPLLDARQPGKPHWLGSYLEESLRHALHGERRIALLPRDAAMQRELAGAHLAPGTSGIGGKAPRAVLRGAVQVVLGMAQVRATLHLPGEAPAEITLRIDLEGGAPEASAREFVKQVHGRIFPGEAVPPLGPHPADWTAVRDGHALLARAPLAADYPARSALLRDLAPWADQPATRAPARAALGALELQQALAGITGTLDGPNVMDDPERRQTLQRAVAHLKAALALRPGDTDWQALLGVALYFLKEDYLARSEGRIALLRNPHNGLAQVALGLAAGLSSGEGRDMLRRAEALEPTLRTANRLPGTPPLLAGILEPYFRRATEINTRNQLDSPRQDGNAYKGVLRDGVAHFEAGRLDAAGKALLQAAREEEGDFTPWLYLARIKLERARGAGGGGGALAQEAAADLKQLDAQHPQQWAILHHLGEAQAMAGDHADAAKAFRKAMGEDPEHAGSRIGLARALLGSGERRQAMTELRGLLQTHPDHVEAWVAMGEARHAQEDLPGARAAWEHVLELAPGHEAATEHLNLLAEQEKKQGQKNEEETGADTPGEEKSP